MGSELFFRLLKLRERLWVQPVVYCLGAILAIWLATLGNALDRPEVLDAVDADMLEMLLRIISTSMLAVATFAVGSLVSAYASASSQGTPRSFQILVADDSSQNALSSFIGAFIFSVVALIALRLNLFVNAGLIVLFFLTLAIFLWVVLTFVGWTDNIARLGRLNTIIAKSEDATAHVLRNRRKTPAMGAIPARDHPELSGTKITHPEIGHVQMIDMEELQDVAETYDIRIAVIASPGTLVRPGASIAILSAELEDDEVAFAVRKCFTISDVRSVAEDPRFGFVIMSEIASRALSPGVNDPGTAIVVISRLMYLFNVWADPEMRASPSEKPEYDRIIMEELSNEDLFNDAFRAMSRDGAGNVEVMICLMKGLVALSNLANGDYREPALRTARQVMARAEHAMVHDFDVDAVHEAGKPLLG